ncbi:MAG: hypothetical protein ACREAU_00370 [Nitrosopumilaceae archaeon]
MICEREEEITTSTIKGHIRRVLELLVQASVLPNSSFEDRVKQAGTVLSELDLLEALDIIGMVVKDRLTPKDVEIQGSNVHLGSHEWSRDPKIGYPQLFRSIRGQVKETIKLNFKRVGQEGVGFLMTHFLKQVVDPILDILQKAGPEQALTQIDSLIEETGHYIKDITRRFHSDDATVARKLLIAHDRLTDILRKKIAPPTREDRYRIIKKVAQKLQPQIQKS